MDGNELIAAIRERMGDRQGEILAHLEHLVKGQEETNTHLRTLNGRVGKTEIEIAVLKDRADDAKDEARKTGSIFGVIGVVLGGVGIAFYERLIGK